MKYALKWPIRYTSCIPHRWDSHQQATYTPSLLAVMTCYLSSHPTILFDILTAKPYNYSLMESSALFTSAEGMIVE
jgi:hypothetical protein